MRTEIRDADYHRLLAFRTGLRRFLRWSAQTAEEAGITPMQHQLLLAVRGHEDKRGPTIGDVASYLLLRHHSAVELVNRAEGAGFVSRQRDNVDHRVVRLQLTDKGSTLLAHLASLSLSELGRLVPQMSQLWEDIPSA